MSNQIEKELLQRMGKGIPGPANGFSVWIEPESLHYHSGGVVQVRALWGIMMQRDGSAEISGWSAYAIDPGGNILEADISQGEGNYNNVGFFAMGEGLYDFVLDNQAGVYSRLPGEIWARGPKSRNPGAIEAVRYIQRARIALPVGHHVRGSLDNVCRSGLDLYCGEFGEYHPGDNVAIRVYYDGKPLPGAEIKGTYHIYTGSEYPWRGVTGSSGEVSFTFNARGHWMFTCTHTHTQPGNTEWDRTVYTSTFVVAGVR